MKFSFKQFIVQHFWQKLFVVLFSLIIMGFSLSFLIEIGWGTDPCSFLNLNISNKIGWTLGNWQVLLNGLILLLILLVKPDLIGFGTIFNMVFIGYTADFFCWVWRVLGLSVFFGTDGALALRIPVFLIAIFIFVVSAAVYMNCSMGVGPYDGLSMVLGVWLPKVPFAPLRIAYDMSVVIIGFLIGLSAKNGVQGSIIGSAVMVFAIGPAVTIIGNFMKKHISLFE